MRVLLQRVKRAAVRVGGIEVSAIGPGLVLLVGVEQADGPEDVTWLATKILSLRLFVDADGKMNRSILDCGGEAIVVSQFTLHARVKKGTRPSFERAARPELAEPLYLSLANDLAVGLGKPVPTGVFGAMMEVDLVNDGPVTIWIDSRDRE